MYIFFLVSQWKHRLPISAAIEVCGMFVYVCTPCMCVAYLCIHVRHVCTSRYMYMFFFFPRDIPVCFYQKGPIFCQITLHSMQKTLYAVKRKSCMLTTEPYALLYSRRTWRPAQHTHTQHTHSHAYTHTCLMYPVNDTGQGHAGAAGEELVLLLPRQPCRLCPPRLPYLCFGYVCVCMYVSVNACMYVWTQSLCLSMYLWIHCKYSCFLRLPCRYFWYVCVHVCICACTYVCIYSWACEYNYFWQLCRLRHSRLPFFCFYYMCVYVSMCVCM